MLPMPDGGGQGARNIFDGITNNEENKTKTQSENVNEDTMKNTVKRFYTGINSDGVESP